MEIFNIVLKNANSSDELLSKLAAIAKKQKDLLTLNELVNHPNAGPKTLSIIHQA